jgi:tryptophan synthase alpha chain
MAYYNTIRACGEETFCSQAVSAGVDGLIIPDMPIEEAGPLQKPAAKAGLDLIFLLAPTSTADRLATVARHSHGFVYYVSLTGITGAKLQNMADVETNVAKIRRVSPVPVAVGFGIATPEHAQRVASLADGVIVGSAIVRRIGERQHDPQLVADVGQFVQSLKQATRQAPSPAA